MTSLGTRWRRVETIDTAAATACCKPNGTASTVDPVRSSPAPGPETGFKLFGDIGFGVYRKYHTQAPLCLVAAAHTVPA